MDVSDSLATPRPPVSIYLRIRPPRSEFTYIDQISPDKKSIRICKDLELRSFSFDRIFTPSDSQVQVCLISALGIIKAVLNGYNGCILAFGQTGSGKTHTILGDLTAKVPGLLLYSMLTLLSARKNVSFELSAVQVYMDKVIDLLPDIKGAGKSSLPLHLMRDCKAVGVSSPEEAERCIEALSLNRKTARTKMNEKSSRSHAVFVLRVTLPDYEEPALLSIVDLAGSERLKKAPGVDPRQLEETIAINSSLTALSKCIHALARPEHLHTPQPLNPSATQPLNPSSSQPHIPFRDSKLTMLLQPSLSGKAYLSLIVAISPDDRDVNEAFSSLRFSTCGARIELRPLRAQPVRARSPEFASPESNKQTNHREEEQDLPSFKPLNPSTPQPFNPSAPSSQRPPTQPLNPSTSHPHQAVSIPRSEPLSEEEEIFQSGFSFKQRALYKSRSESEIEHYRSHSPILASEREAPIPPSQISDELIQLRLENATLRAKLQTTINESDYPLLAKAIGGYLLTNKPSFANPTIDELLCGVKSRFLALEAKTERCRLRANLAGCLGVWELSEDQVALAVRRLIAGKKIVRFLEQKFREKKALSKPEHYRAIKVAMGKNALTQAFKSLSKQLAVLGNQLK